MAPQRRELAASIPGWGRTDSLILAAVVAGGMLLGLLLGQDYGLSWDEPLIASYVDRLLRAYHAFDGKDAVLEDLHFYGPLYFLIADQIAHWLRDLLNGWSLVDGRHVAYFACLILATASVYAMARGMVNRVPALLCSLLMASQPLLFGHAFINPKDVPFLGFFAATVALGYWAVWSATRREGRTGDSLAGPERGPRDGPGTTHRTLRDVPRGAIAMAGLIVVLGTLLVVSLAIAEKEVRDAILAIEAAYSSGDIPAGIQGVIEWLAPQWGELPIDDYIHKVIRLHRRLEIGLWAALAVTSVSLLTAYVARRQRGDGRRFLILWIATGILAGATTAIRPLGPFAGVLVCALLFVKLRRSAWLPVALYWLILILVAYAAWPYLWGRPLGNYLSALNVASQFPWDYPVLFGGDPVSASDLPWYYPPAILAIQLTLPAILLAGAGTIRAIAWGRRNARLMDVLVLFAWLTVPLVAIVALDSNVYDNARQFLFILPPVFVLAGFGAAWMLSVLRAGAAQVVAVLLILLPGLLGLIRLHPYEYIYYNELVGGVEGAEGEFELDYWATGYREAMHYLNSVAPPSSSVAVAGSRATAVGFAREDLRMVRGGLGGEESDNADFLVATTRWDNAEEVWAEAPIIWELKRDGATLVVIKDLRRED